MKKLLNGLQWILAAVLAAVIIFMLLRRQPASDYHPDTWHSWDGFAAISYAGVTSAGDGVYPSSRTLKEHLEALKLAGYHTITPDDALAFVQRRAPLPDKALLILFEEGRKETLIRAAPLLGHHGLLATMCVATRSMETWDSSGLSSGDIKKLAHAGLWSVASMGNHAVEVIPIDNANNTGHFLTTRLWRKKEGSLETPDEFRTRVIQDYTISASLLREATGKAAGAYVYPFADTGVRMDAEPLAAAANHGAVTSLYHMAFTTAHDPFNAPGSDLFALTRFRVPGTWSAKQLIEELEKSRPLRAPVSGFGGISPWMLVGDAHLETNGLAIKKDGIAWLRGSDRWSDLEMAATMTCPAGAVLVAYARHANAKEYVRATITQTEVCLQECRQGHLDTLSRMPLKAAPGQSIVFHLKLKGNRAWMAANDAAVGGPVPLSGGNSSGRVGVGCMTDGGDISAIVVTPSKPLYALTDSWTIIPEAMKGSIRGALFQWGDASQGLSVDADRRQTLVEASARGISAIPLLSFAAPVDDRTAAGKADGFIEALKEAGAQPFVRSLAVDISQRPLIAALRDRGLSVVVRCTPSDREAMKDAVLLSGNDDMMFLDFTGQDSCPLLESLLHRYPPERLIVRQDKVTDLPEGVARVTTFTGTDKRHTQ